LPGFEPAAFIETGTRLTIDFAGIHLGRFVQHVTRLLNEPESSSLEEISCSVTDLKMRVAALDYNQTLQRTVVDELAIQVGYTSARGL